LKRLTDDAVRAPPAQDCGGTPRGDWGALGHPLVEHWNGAKWRLVRLPRTPAGSILVSISAATSGDIWSVGTQFPRNGNTFPPLGEHWNGSNWRVSSPPGVNGSGFYNDVVARTHTDVWAVGAAGRRALAAHWNGTRWQLGAPKTPGNSSYLASVDSVPTTTHVWAAGGTTPVGSTRGRILIERHC
jgi:hypothetical protein